MRYIDNRKFNNVICKNKDDNFLLVKTIKDSNGLTNDVKYFHINELKECMEFMEVYGKNTVGSFEIFATTKKEKEKLKFGYKSYAY